jgi:hypothetical protein
MEQGQEESEGKKLVIEYGQVTKWGPKTTGHLAQLMLSEECPHIFCAVETHLHGHTLNTTRRRLASMGWHTFATPAVAT